MIEPGQVHDMNVADQSPVSPDEPPGSFSTLSADEALPRWVRVVQRISTAVALPAAVVTFLLMLHVIGDVVGRSLFNSPLPGTLEISQYWWMMLIVFGGLALAQVNDEHLRATVIIEKLPLNWQRWVDAGSCALLCLIALVIGLAGYVAGLESFRIGEATSSTPPIVIWPFMFAVPFGFGALALQCVASIYLAFLKSTVITPESEMIL
jgi:TRAP-type C4-dicarboxylate transport system permease small subunit